MSGFPSSKSLSLTRFSPHHCQPLLQLMCPSSRSATCLLLQQRLGTHVRSFLVGQPHIDCMRLHAVDGVCHRVFRNEAHPSQPTWIQYDRRRFSLSHCRHVSDRGKGIHLVVPFRNDRKLLRIRVLCLTLPRHPPIPWQSANSSHSLHCVVRLPGCPLLLQPNPAEIGRAS